MAAIDVTQRERNASDPSIKRGIIAVDNSIEVVLA